MKTKELKSISSPTGKVWIVGGKALITVLNGARSIATISRITDGRGGTIYLQKNNLIGTPIEVAFDMNGNLRGAGQWDRTSAMPITQEEETNLRKEFKVINLRNKFSTYNWATVSDEKILQIDDIID